MRITFLALAALPLCSPLPLAAQDVSAEPTFATLNVEADFRPDPRTVDVISGGEIDAAELGGDCSGYIADVPDVRINYTSGKYPLTFYVTSDSDTTLVINAPDGNWYCDDDGSGTTDPVYRFAKPQTGAYDVFVGSYEDDNAEARLSITEVDE